MGQQNSKTEDHFKENFHFKEDGYFIPTNKLFKMSYVIHENIKTLSIPLNDINLDNNNFKDINKIPIIMQFIYYKLKNVGYNLTPLKIDYPYYNIDDILSQINSKGIPVLNHTSLNDFKIIKQCYEPSLNNIYHFLNKGNILLGGIILNEEFINDVLKIDKEPYIGIISDLILIVGYNPDNIFIKTNWCKKNIKVKNEYLNNIKEIWNVEIKTFY